MRQREKKTNYEGFKKNPPKSKPIWKSMSHYHQIWQI